MALIECWECGEEVSDSADRCPNCGARHPSSKGAARADQGEDVGRWAGAALILLLAVAVFGWMFSTTCGG